MSRRGSARITPSSSSPDNIRPTAPPTEILSSSALGAALVFLIDWNKARKLLRSWVAKDDATRILDWAARQRIGQRGFLELGGNELIGAAVRNAAPTRIGFGERLDQALGRNAAVDFLKTAMRVSTEALSCRAFGPAGARPDRGRSGQAAGTRRQRVACDRAAPDRIGARHHCRDRPSCRRASGGPSDRRQAARRPRRPDRAQGRSHRDRGPQGSRSPQRRRDHRTAGGPRRGGRRRTGTGRLHRLAGAGGNRCRAADGARRIMRGRHDRDRSRRFGARRGDRGSGRAPRRFRGRAQRRRFA